MALDNVTFNRTVLNIRNKYGAILCCYIWDKVFKIGSSKICGREPVKNLKGFGQLKQTISIQIF